MSRQQFMQSHFRQRCLFTLLQILVAMKISSEQCCLLKIVLCFSTTKSKWFVERQNAVVYVNIYEAQESIKFAFEKLFCPLDLNLLSSTAV